MKLLYSLAFAAIRIFNKKFPYFLCCASCGEIKETSKFRFCSSLSPLFSVSAVVMVSPRFSLSNFLSQLTMHYSWISNIIFITKSSEMVKFASIDKSNNIPISVIPFGSEDANHVVLKKLFGLQELSEQFLFFQNECLVNRDIHILEFFTPNGLPLLKVKTRDLENISFGNVNFCHSVLALTKDMLRELPASFQPLNKDSIMQFFLESSNSSYVEGKILLIEDK